MNRSPRRKLISLWLHRCGMFRIVELPFRFCTASALMLNGGTQLNKKCGEHECATAVIELGRLGILSG